MTPEEYVIQWQHAARQERLAREALAVADAHLDEAVALVVEERRSA